MAALLSGAYRTLNAPLTVQKVGFMSLIRSVAMWVVWNIPCGNFAPRLMGFALNSKPVKSNTRRI